jgi:uncharacterized protein
MADHTPVPAPTVPRQAQPAYLFVCRDGPDAPRLRVQHLDGHLAHVEANWQRYVVAGPIKSPGTTTLNGSVFIVSAPDVEEAWALMKGDPYITSGQYSQIEVHDLTLSIGQFVGGKIWESADAIRHRATGG